jgi:hypothetical protein
MMTAETPMDDLRTNQGLGPFLRELRRRRVLDSVLGVVGEWALC